MKLLNILELLTGKKKRQDEKKKANVVDTVISSSEKIEIDKMPDVSDTLFMFSDKKEYSKIIPNETVKKILDKYDIEFGIEWIVRKMEQYPELVDLLLNEDVSIEIISLICYPPASRLPLNEKDIKFIKYLDLDEKLQKKAALLDNLVDESSINDDYIACPINLMSMKKAETISITIDSFITGVSINLGEMTLTEIDSYSNFVVYLPKSKYRIVNHGFYEYVYGNIIYDEDVIVQMNYDSFNHFLSKEAIDSFSGCRIVISDEKPKLQEKKATNYDSFNYSLLKYNHLLYVIENSSLDEKTKDRSLYEIKMLLTDNYTVFDFQLRVVLEKYLKLISKEEIVRLTSEFESHVDEYKNKGIERPKFNATYYIEKNYINFDNVTVNDIVLNLNLLPDDQKLAFISDPRIKKKLKIDEKIVEQELLKIIELLKQGFSITIAKFIVRLDIDLDEFVNNPNNVHQSSLAINEIVRKYGVFDSCNEEIEISVADIVGHDYYISVENILKTFSLFYEEDGDGYHIRSLGLLKYKTGEELLRGLKATREYTNDMGVRYIDDGKYIIYSNGLHRYSVLRFHYLLDVMKGEKSLDELRKMYTIPVRIWSRTNFFKTYCTYIIMKADQNIKYIYFDKAGKFKLVYGSDTRDDVSFEEDKLLELTQKVSETLDDDSFQEVISYYKKYDSFKSFVDQYLPSIVKRMGNVDEEVLSV